MLACTEQKIKMWDMEERKYKRSLAVMSRKEKLNMVFLYCIVFLFYLLERIKGM